jgi:hypothetical protein
MSRVNDYTASAALVNHKTFNLSRVLNFSLVLTSSDIKPKLLLRLRLRQKHRHRHRRMLRLKLRQLLRLVFGK